MNNNIIYYIIVGASLIDISIITLVITSALMIRVNNDPKYDIAKELDREINNEGTVDVDKVDNIIYYNSCVMVKIDGEYRYLDKLQDKGQRKLPNNVMCIYVCGFNTTNSVIMNSDVKDWDNIFYIDARKLNSVDESLYSNLLSIYKSNSRNLNNYELYSIRRLFNRLLYTGMSDIDRLIDKGRLGNYNDRDTSGDD